MTTFQTLLVVLDLFELGLAAGASTFALTFYYMGIKDGKIDASERNFMGAVYFVLRVALVVIIATEVFYVFRYGIEAFPLVQTAEVLWFRWMLIGVIIVNAILMQFHKMPMWLGPALAGGSWYGLFFATVWPDLTASFSSLVAYYAAFLGVMVVFLNALKALYVPKKSKNT